MKMKKLTALLLSLAMVFALASCGSSGTTNVSTGGTSSASDASDAGTSAAASASTDETKDDGSLTEVTVQLKWVQQAQFMGYYAAKELGIYEDFGLDVTIVPGGSVDVVDEVDNGRAQFADVCPSMGIRYRPMSGVRWCMTTVNLSASGASASI